MAKIHVPDRRVCAVCAIVLEHKDGEWFHLNANPDTFDHIAVPVDDTDVDVREICDFCSAEGADYLVPARSFALPNGWQGSDGDWAACEPCATLIDGNRWNRLIDRIVEVSNSALPEEDLRAAVTPLYRKLRQNINGAVRRIE